MAIKIRERKLPVVLVIIICLICIGLPALYFMIGHAGRDAYRTFQGSDILSARSIFTPYPMVAHIIVVELHITGDWLLVTPAIQPMTPAQSAHPLPIRRSCRGADCHKRGWIFPLVGQRTLDYFPHQVIGWLRMGMPCRRVSPYGKKGAELDDLFL